MTAALRTALGDDQGRIVVQVREVPDLRSATQALRHAVDDFAALGSTYRGTVLPVPTGPVAGLMDVAPGESTPDDVLAAFPDLIVNRLEEAGVVDAVVTLPSSEGPEIPYDLPRAVVLRLYPPPPRRDSVPEDWLEEASAWVCRDLGPDERLWVRAGLQFPLRAEQVRGWLAGAQQDFDAGALIAGDPPVRVRTAAFFTVCATANLVLGAGGPASTDEELLRTPRSWSPSLAGCVTWATPSSASRRRP